MSSRQWPSISRYRACVRTQSPKVEMIDSLYKRVSDTEDDGIIRYGVWFKLSAAFGHDTLLRAVTE